MQTDEIELLIKRGRLFEAYNELESAITGNSLDLRIKQLYGLTLARLGLLDRARAVMEKLASEHKDTETSGILGRIYKDYWKLTGDPGYLDLSVSTYRDAFIETKDGYNGINAATLTCLSGARGEAESIARDTIRDVMNWSDGYWKDATLGEAYLLTGEYGMAREHYSRANESGRGDTGSIHSTVSQLRMLSGVIPEAEEMMGLFDEPVIVIFAGHMIDSPARSIPRFPESASDSVRREIEKYIDSNNVKIGYSGLACGGDILFAEAMIERGLELNIVLPFRVEDFVRTSVEFAGSGWMERFDAAMEKAGSVKFTTGEGYYGEDFMFDLCARQVMGMGILRAGLFGVEPLLLTVWDEKTGATGGTADSVNWFPWKERHHNINPSMFPAAPAGASGKPLPGGAPGESLPLKRSMKYILFSDVKGFSKLDEEMTPLFVLRYLSAVSEKLGGFNPSPEVLNTWGDAVFAVMESPSSLAEYAFALQEAVLGTDWKGEGLPEMNLRIALHAGPVYIAHDPLIGSVNAYGTHINRAARMEPVTAPGSIYASEQFAAALLLEKHESYIFDYAGMIELPKKFGKQEMFRVRRKER